jgi:signal transduction histidine kinase
MAKEVNIVSDQELWERFLQLKRYVDLSDDDCELIWGLYPVVEPHFGAMCEDFYAEILRHSGASSVITGGVAQVDRLKQTLYQWLTEFFRGPYDEVYAKKHWKVGSRHVQIGLNQSFTQVAMTRLRTGIMHVVFGAFQHDSEKLKAIELAISKMIDLDLAIIQLAYEEELLRKQQQAERLSAIGQMGGGIAHELRNPLNVLQTSLYLLQHSKNMDAARRDVHIERMQRQIQLANQTITALSEFTRLGPLNKKRIEIVSWLDEMLRDNFGEKISHIRRQVEPSDLSILADSSQLGIAVRNLVANALEAMSDSGVVTIAISRNPGHSESITIDVIDQGTGIPDDIRVRLTEPLFTTKTRGLGLGLALVRSIVERHGGVLKIQSTSSEGSVFRMELPTV